MNDEKLREAYERGLPPSDGSPALDDVSAERLRRLVEGEGSESERLRTLDVALSSAEGRRELEIAWAAARAARPQRRSWQRFTLAASVLIVVGLGASTLWLWQHNLPATTVLRSSDSPVTLVAPVGEVGSDRATRFVWRAVGKADRYQIVVVDTTGTEMYAGETRDTALTLPDSVHLVPGQAYLWWVQARLSDQSTVTAVTQRLVVTAK
jgi:hypothetical protein